MRGKNGMVGHGCALLVNEHNIVKLNWSTSSGSRLMGRCVFICIQITKSSDESNWICFHSFHTHFLLSRTRHFLWKWSCTDNPGSRLLMTPNEHEEPSRDWQDMASCNWETKPHTWMDSRATLFFSMSLLAHAHMLPAQKICFLALKSASSWVQASLWVKVSRTRVSGN